MGNHVTANVFRDLPGNLSRYWRRKIRRFNVIPRAEKMMDNIQKTPIRAPIPEATQKQIEELIKELPGKFDELNERKEPLHKRLEDVYVTSEGVNPKLHPSRRVKSGPLWKSNSTQQQTEVPVGRYNSSRAEHFLAANARDPKTYNADILADVYKVEPNAMKNILEFVKLYSVVVPTKRTEVGFSEKLAKDVLPANMYGETEMEAVETRLLLAEEMLAKFYKKELSNPLKRNSDYTMLETLAFLKPFVSELKRDLRLGKIEVEEKREQKQEELKEELVREYQSPNEVRYERVVTPEEAEAFLREYYEAHVEKDQKCLSDTGLSKKNSSVMKKGKLDDVEALREEKISEKV